MKATIVGGPLDGEEIEFQGCAVQIAVELPLPQVGDFRDEPLWRYSPTIDPERYYAYWSQFQRWVTLVPERVGDRFVLRWPDEEV